ncbi:MAG TPA: helix-turn-helix transcriptional regulator [Thermoanaerobaculia bacterium]|nr:helix-turn-helix transcriptional regulator [Thermoanaerobaculia bacterium]
MRPNPAVDEAVERLRRALGRRIRDEGKSLRAVEDLLGVSRDYLSQLLRGSMHLKVKHLYAVLEALEVEPGAFLLAVFPPTAGASDREAARLDAEFIGARQEVSIAVLRKLVRTLQERGLLSAEEGEQLLAPLATHDNQR